MTSSTPTRELRSRTIPAAGTGSASSATGNNNTGGSAGADTRIITGDGTTHNNDPDDEIRRMEAEQRARQDAADDLARAAEAARQEADRGRLETLRRIRARLQELEAEEARLLGHAAASESGSSNNGSVAVPTGALAGSSSSPAPIVPSARLFPETQHMTFEQEQDWIRTQMGVEKAIPAQGPKEYRGKNQRELMEFDGAWSSVFRAKPITFQSQSTRVNTAATSLRGDVQARWREFLESGETVDTWKKFIDFLSNSIQSPDQRHNDAFRELRLIEQGKYESVSDLFMRIRQLQRNLKEPMKNEQQIQLFKDAITHHETGKQLDSMIYERRPTTMEGMLQAAAIAEERVRPNLRKRNAEESSHSNAGNPPPSGSGNSSQRGGGNKRGRGNRRGGSHNSSQNVQESSSSPSHTVQNSGSGSKKQDKKCDTCGSKDHWTGYFYCPKDSEWKHAHPQKARQREEKYQERVRLQAAASTVPGGPTGTPSRPSRSEENSGKAGARS